MRFYDNDTEMDLGWATKYFGRQDVLDHLNDRFEVDSLWSASGYDPVLIVRFIDEAGAPISTQIVAIEPRGTGPSSWVRTGSDGTARISMAENFFQYYVDSPESQGPYTITPADEPGNIYCSAGKVFLGRENKRKLYRWFNVTFRRIGAVPAPPEPTPLAQKLSEQLDIIAQAAQSIRDLLVQ